MGYQNLLSACAYAALGGFFAFLIVSVFRTAPTISLEEGDYSDSEWTSEEIKQEQSNSEWKPENVEQDYSNEARAFSQNSHGKSIYGPRRRFPDVVIAGAKKCGTSTLVTMLSSAHKRIKSPNAEVHFYDTNFDKGYSWYLKKMPIASDDVLVLEKTPRYFLSQLAADEIRKMGSSVILMLCDPITRLLSDYGHYMRHTTSYLPFEDVVLDEKGNVSRTAELVLPKHLPKFLSYFPLGEKLHLVDGDNFAKRPWEELELLEQFLKLDPILSHEENFVLNDEEGKEHLYCWWLNGKGDQKTKKCMHGQRGNEHISLSDEMEGKLRSFFEPFNKQLYQMTGRDFIWNTDA